MCCCTRGATQLRIAEEYLQEMFKSIVDSNVASHNQGSGKEKAQRVLHQALSFSVIITTEITIVVVENMRHAAAACGWCGAVLLEDTSSLCPIPLKIVQLLEGLAI